MAEKQNVIQEKEKVMDEMFTLISHWDGQLDSGLEILLKNKELIQLMQTLDEKLTKEELVHYNKKYQKEWQDIIQKHKILHEAILSEKDMIEEQLVQIGKKDKIVSNYINLQKESAFIEKEY